MPCRNRSLYLYNIMLCHKTLLLTLCSTLGTILPLGEVLAAWHKTEKAVMGTIIRVEVWHQDQASARKAISSVLQEMRRIDREMSPYKKDSQLSRLNRLASKKPVRVSPELFSLIWKSKKISQLTNGAFDITYASIGRLYDYRKRIAPDEKTIRKNLPNINYRHVLMYPKTRSIQYARKGVYIDLGGIAKGHAVDQSIRILKKQGIRNAIVTAGGDSRIIGDKKGKPWMIGIRNPRKARSVSAILPLVDTAVSTSGDYERYFIRNGVHHHHILNPGTGRSAKKLISATILAPDSTTADALSTSVFILGPVKGMKLVESLPGIEAVLINPKGKMLYSTGLMQAKSRKNSP